MIQDLIQLIRSHLAPSEVKPLGQIGVFHCHRHQRLRSVPIHHPSVVLVLEGTKRVTFAARQETLGAGELAFLPAGSELLMENIPCPDRHEYLALCLSFSPETVQRFLTSYGHRLDWPAQQPRFTAPAPEDLVRLITQRVTWCQAGDVDDWILNDLKQQEILSLCGHHRLLGLLLPSRHLSWQQQVSGLVSLDLSHRWKVGEVGQRLGVSESALRRHLQEENTSFSDILEQARLITALGLLQETQYSVARVAEQVGYQSPSRFTERFKQRFGVTPSQLKQSREQHTDALID